MGLWLAVVCAACLAAGWLGALLWRDGQQRRWARMTCCVRCGRLARRCRCGALRDEHTRRRWWRREYGQPLKE